MQVSPDNSARRLGTSPEQGRRSAPGRPALTILLLNILEQYPITAIPDRTDGGDLDPEIGARAGRPKSGEDRFAAKACALRRHHFEVRGKGRGASAEIARTTGEQFHEGGVKGLDLVGRGGRQRVMMPAY